jgi:hypothetical protein
MTTVENVEGSRSKNKVKHPQDRGGHRYQKGHPQYPRWRVGAALQAYVFTRRSAKILRAIVAERDGELSVTQLIHARNVADIGAAKMEIKDQRKAGKPFDKIAYAKLVKAESRELEKLDE